MKPSPKTLRFARYALRDLGRTVHTQRTAEGKSLDMLAVELKMSKPYLHHIEHGRFLPEPEQMARLLDWLNTRSTQ